MQYMPRVLIHSLATLALHGEPLDAEAPAASAE
jgi:hypothetical protein